MVGALDHGTVLHRFTSLWDFASGTPGDLTIIETGRGVHITG